MPVFDEVVMLQQLISYSYAITRLARSLTVLHSDEWGHHQAGNTWVVFWQIRDENADRVPPEAEALNDQNLSEIGFLWSRYHRDYTADTVPSGPVVLTRFLPARFA